MKLFRPEVKIGAIDASGNRKLLQEFGFKGYPTMKMFIEGGKGGDQEAEEEEGRGILYDGGRNAEEIIEYLQNVEAKPVKKDEL